MRRKIGDRAVEHLGEGMERADFGGRAGEGDVDVRERRRFVGGAEALAVLREFRGDGVARFVQQLADERTLLLAERFHLLAPNGDAAAAAEIADAQRFERLLVRRRGDLAQRGVAEFFERMGHVER